MKTSARGHSRSSMWASASMEGRSEVAIAAGRKVAANVRMEQIAEYPAVEFFHTIPLLSLVRFGRWQELLELAHLAVVPRPGRLLPVAGTLADLLESRRAAAAEAFATSPAGRIYVHQGAQLDVSSSGLRATLEAGRDPRYLMPESVRRMILETGTYARRGSTSE